MWYLAGVSLFVVGALCVMVTGALVLDSVPGGMRPGLFGELPRRVLLGNSRLLTQHYDRYLPFGLTLIVGVSWIRLCEARPQP